MPKPKICEYIDCNTRASYGLINDVRKYCGKHKINNMIDLNNKLCENENCVTRASFNYIGQTKAKYCVEHKLIDMIDVKNKKCMHL